MYLLFFDINQGVTGNFASENEFAIRRTFFGVT
jgi:hypothetical protein